MVQQYINPEQSAHDQYIRSLPALQYHMWTRDQTIKLKDIDRLTREVIREKEGMPNCESFKLLYLSEELGDSGMRNVEDTYKLTTI